MRTKRARSPRSRRAESNGHLTTTKKAGYRDGDISNMAPTTLFAESKPYKEEYLQVSDLSVTPSHALCALPRTWRADRVHEHMASTLACSHSIWIGQYGKPDGKPAVFIHGGYICTSDSCSAGAHCSRSPPVLTLARALRSGNACRHRAQTWRRNERFRVSNGPWVGAHSQDTKTL